MVRGPPKMYCALLVAARILEFYTSDIYVTGDGTRDEFCRLAIRRMEAGYGQPLTEHHFDLLIDVLCPA